MDLKNSVALITGAAKRVGKSIAQALAKKGVSIILHYHHSEDEAYRTATLLEKEGIDVFPIKADLSKTEEIENLVQTALKKTKKIDILINSASQFKETPFDSITEADWDLHLNTNLKAIFFLSKFVSTSMLQQKRGKIVNIIDAHIDRPYCNYLPYLVSKSGLVGLTYCLAKELAPHIQVNGISPGPVLVQPEWGQKMIEEIKSSIPLQHIGSPDDIANGVLFCLEGTDFMTGTIIPIDGGQRLQ